jgi:hypothetical protein
MVCASSVLPAPGGSGEQEVVPAGQGHLERPAGPGLPADIAQVGSIVPLTRASALRLGVTLRTVRG